MAVPIIDLFAGAGGLSLGATMAGTDVRLSIEIDDICCQTLSMNKQIHRGEVLCEDILLISGEQLREAARLRSSDSLLMIGGPPCQPFSKAAYWTDSGEEARFRRARARGEKVRRTAGSKEPKPDQRRSLLWEFFRLVIESRAEGFVLENVPSILHPRNKATFLMLVSAFEEQGYRTLIVKNSAAEFGVPQLRERVFLLGLKKERPVAPIPIHSTNGGDGLFLKPARPVRPAIERFSGDEYYEPEEVVTGRWADKLHEIPPGRNYKHHTVWAGHPNPCFETETRFWNFLLKLHPERPSWTIAATPGPWTGPFHWDSRRLRTSELAAIQGFPAEYQFAGPRREKVRQIGNAVPPPLAQHMIEQVANRIAGTSLSIDCQRPKAKALCGV